MRLIDLSVRVSSCVSVCLCTRIGGDMHPNKPLLVFDAVQDVFSNAIKINEIDSLHRSGMTRPKQDVYVQRLHRIRQTSVHERVRLCGSILIDVGGLYSVSKG